MFRLRNSSVLDALVAVLFTCGVHERSSLSVTPRYLAPSTDSSGCLCNLYVGCLRNLLIVQIWITWHFSGCKCICHILSHSCKASRSFWSSVESASKLISLYKSPSSANNRVFDVVTSGKSLMNARKRSGPRTVPCGTPKRTSACDDRTPSRRTCCCL